MTDLRQVKEKLFEQLDELQKEIIETEAAVNGFNFPFSWKLNDAIFIKWGLYLPQREFRILFALPDSPGESILAAPIEIRMQLIERFKNFRNELENFIMNKVNELTKQSGE